MRVIAGIAKGRRLAAPRAGSVRPSKDRVKEALFSSLGGRVQGARVLDLYAGSGALGIEALSRGATSATFVESDPEAVAAIESNLRSTGLEQNAHVLMTTAERFIDDVRGERFDILLIDPPYDLGLPSDVLAGIMGADLLAEGAIVAVEVSSHLEVHDVGSYREVGRKRYGDSSVIYLESPEG